MLGLQVGLTTQNERQARWFWLWPKPCLAVGCFFLSFFEITTDDDVCHLRALEVT